MRYTFIIEISCMCMCLTSLLTEFRKGNLTYREWLPYDYSSNILLFCITYFHQLICLTIASIVNVACDNIIWGLLLHICGQTEILECRLRKSLRDQSTFGECVYLHDCIYKSVFIKEFYASRFSNDSTIFFSCRYAHTMNKKFSFIIGVQFIVSTLVVCSNLYRLAKTEISAKYIEVALYTNCMLMQILIYCWHGNEVKLKVSINMLSITTITKDYNIIMSYYVILSLEISNPNLFKRLRN